ncbi:outer membrane protein assembly factor BamE [Phaeovibrio sulfidiphilus]|uniref:Outer membrane protein assembly factor BamE n=1 Tax=Phaeovibrio sulfidiphilus TaxID=1220600 RepID=A0A8J7CPX3_9PROT|nr:outer membrane protein assembly factor BamE [Phaeovibrio sulfidiphilus]MBE1236195.1 outer membrane protein assembly factor BamE [Phaeovibrio sulfidiphilus]
MSDSSLGTHRLRARVRSPLAGAAAALALTLSGCANEIDARGNLPSETSVQQVQPGVHTRADVQALLGTPSATALYDSAVWYYISSHTTQYAFLKPEELDRQVLIVEFDRAGVVSDVIRIFKEDGEEVSISARETPARGTEQNVIQEFFGNLGRFTPSKVGR